MASNSLTDLLVYALLAQFVILTVWYLHSTISPPSPPPPQLREKRIVLLIAHPDDESMFFAPTVLKLADPSMGNHVKILCLSTGNAAGLGDTRRKELEVAALKLGIRRSEDVFLMDDVRFKDGMDTKWDQDDIAKVLMQAFAPYAGLDAKKKGSSGGPRATIDALITFDRHGISLHPNHIALYHGAKRFLNNLMADHKGHTCPITLYALASTNILRKYIFVFDVLPTYFAGIMGDVVDGFTGKRKPSVKGSKNVRKGDRVMFVSNIPSYMRARSAMTAAHKSQMVWFRYGWITLGRYMVVNDLKREEF